MENCLQINFYLNHGPVWCLFTWSVIFSWLHRGLSISFYKQQTASYHLKSSKIRKFTLSHENYGGVKRFRIQASYIDKLFIRHPNKKRNEFCGKLVKVKWNRIKCLVRTVNQIFNSYIEPISTYYAYWKSLFSFVIMSTVLWYR